MLAKEIKIRTLKKQRVFIGRMLLKMTTHKDGDAAYRYVGHVYPEVIKHFEDEGFKVIRVESDMLTARHEGLPTYLFVVGDDVELSEEEKKEAEAIEIKKDDDELHCGGFDAPMSSILGGGGFAN